jgi:hypothetical protein
VPPETPFVGYLNVRNTNDVPLPNSCIANNTVDLRRVVLTTSAIVGFSDRERALL